MTHVATALLSLGGFALLFLAMARHQQDWLRRKLPDQQSRRLRQAGFALLSIAFLIAGLGLGWGYGSVAWFGWLSYALKIRSITYATTFHWMPFPRASCLSWGARGNTTWRIWSR